MLKRTWKKYGKIIAAAAFLTAAGFYYGFVENADEMVVLNDMGRPVVTETADISEGIPVSGGENNQANMNLNGNGAAGTSAEDAGNGTPAGFFVHICGEVKNPGVYELPEGSRIFEAVEAAGGLTAQAAESSMNLAEKITDGMQIVILSREEMEMQESAARETASGLVNINTASREQLMTLPGIGESRADDIIRYREESGGFQTIEDIKKVSGIKDAAFQKIKDSITV